MSDPRAILHVASARFSREYAISGMPVSIGRSIDNAVILDDDDVSHHHALLEFRKGSYFLTDRGSKFGILINGARLPANQPRELDHGEFFHIAGFRLALEATTTESMAAIEKLAKEMESLAPAQLVLVRPSRIYLTVATPAGERRIELQDEHLQIGRDPRNEICIDHNVVSRRHAQLQRTNHGYEIRDLESVNGLIYLGRSVDCKLLADGDELSITKRIQLRYTIEEIDLEEIAPVFRPGQQSPFGDEIRRRTTAAAKVDEDTELPMHPIDLGDRDQISIGRSPENDLHIEIPTVSRFHAVISRSGPTSQYSIQDLDSSNGTLVNNTYIKPEKRVPLEPGDVIRIGPIRFVFEPGEIKPLVNESRNMRLDALRLNQYVGKDINLLQDISLSVLPREFVAIVGVSGAGKSTIMNALSGFRPASDGRVLVNGIDLYSHFDNYRTDIGYVPQDDIIHKELPTQKALDYVARLRLPSDLTAAERKAVVEEELSALGLAECRDVPVGNLSGGQRKRVSIGVERLTRPGLFFLDEATSGLDPGTENKLMRLLRKLADEGQTILLITHATKNVARCDLVVFLARGGHLAYFGPPDQALSYFEVQDFDEIYEKLQDERSPGEWSDVYKNSPQYQQYLVGRVQEKYGQNLTVKIESPDPVAVDVVAPSRMTKKAKQPSSLRQFFVLSMRYLDITRRDRTNFLLLLLIAPLLGAMDFIAWNRDIFDPESGKPFEVMTMLFLFAIIPFLVGALSSVREIVKEKAIYMRERTVNLKIVPYLGSKVAVGALFALYHAAAFMIIKLLAVDFSHLNSGDLLVQYLVLFLVVMSGVMWGLLISAIAPREEQAMLLVIIVVVIHMVFSGGILSLEQLGPAGEGIGYVTSTKWAFEGFSDLNGLMSGDCEAPGLAGCQHPGIQGVGSEAGQAALIDQLTERFGDIFDGSVQNTVIAQLAIIALLFITLIIIQRRKDVI